MNYTLIPREEAPAPAPLRTKRRIEGIDELVDELVPGKVARIELAEGERPRAVIEQLFKTAARHGKMIDVWEVGGTIYAELIGA